MVNIVLNWLLFQDMKDGNVRIMANNGGVRILVGRSLWRTPCSWPDLAALRDMCHRIFRLKPMTSLTQCTFHFQINSCTQSGSDTLRLICISLYDFLVMSEVCKLKKKCSQTLIFFTLYDLQFSFYPGKENCIDPGS